MSRAGGALRAGDLDDRVTIQEPTETQDDFGDVSSSWGTLLSMWARVTAVSGEEDFEAMGLDATISHTIEGRWRDGITAKMRAVVTYRQGGTDTLDVTSVQRVGASDMLILCTELAD